MFFIKRVPHLWTNIALWGTMFLVKELNCHLFLHPLLYMYFLLADKTKNTMFSIFTCHQGSISASTTIGYYRNVNNTELVYSGRSLSQTDASIVFNDDGSRKVSTRSGMSISITQILVRPN